MTENIENIESAQDALGDEVHDLSHLSDADIEEALSEALNDDPVLEQDDDGEGQN